MPEIGHLYKTPAHAPILSRLPLRLLPGAGRERPRDRPMHDERRDQPVPQCYWLWLSWIVQRWVAEPDASTTANPTTQTSLGLLRRINFGSRQGRRVEMKW